MSNMKCPFCQQELKEIYCNGICVGLACKNVGCLETKSTLGNKALWQELIRTRKALDVAVDALDRIDKQLMTGIEMTSEARNALEQITALEQKDVK